MHNCHFAAEQMKENVLNIEYHSNSLETSSLPVSMWDHWTFDPPYMPYMEGQLILSYKSEFYRFFSRFWCKSHLHDHAPEYSANLDKSW